MSTTNTYIKIEDSIDIKKCDSGVSSGSNSSECLFCLEGVDIDRDDIVTLECECKTVKIYHKKCFDEWKQKKSECPLCNCFITSRNIFTNEPAVFVEEKPIESTVIHIEPQPTIPYKCINHRSGKCLCVIAVSLFVLFFVSWSIITKKVII